MPTQPTPATPAQQLRAEFAEARRVTREAWSEREVLASLDRAETIALLALELRPEPARQPGVPA